MNIGTYDNGVSALQVLQSEMGCISGSQQSTAGRSASLQNESRCREASVEGSFASMVVEGNTNKYLVASQLLQLL